MNDLFQLIQQLIQLLPEAIDEFDEQESAQLLAFLQNLDAYLTRQQEPVPPTTYPPGTDLLWILAGQDPNAFVNYLRTYPGPGFRQLAANPAHLASVIEMLQRQNPWQPPHVQPDGMDSTLYRSSNVAGMRYDPSSKKLYVKFHGVNQEPVYQYEQVPPQIFSLLQHGNAFAQTRGRNRWGQWWPMKNPSIGAALNQYLKAGGYPYQRLS